MIQWIYHLIRSHSLSISGLQREVSTRDERDPAVAHYLRRLYEQGNKTTATVLARHYYHRQFFIRASKWLKIGIDLNHQEAQLAYATYSSIDPAQYSSSLCRSHLEAFPTDTSYTINDWIERGAKRGDPDAMFHFGSKLLSGKKIACDHAQGIYWLLCASALEHPQAAQYLFTALAKDALHDNYVLSKPTSARDEDSKPSLLWDIYHHCDLTIEPWWPIDNEIDIEKRTWFMLEVAAQLSSIDASDKQSVIINEVYRSLYQRFKNTLEGADRPLISSVVKALRQPLEFCESQGCLITSSGVPVLNLNWMPGRMHTPPHATHSNT